MAYKLPAQVLVSWLHVGRLRSEAAFADGVQDAAGAASKGHRDSGRGRSSAAIPRGDRQSVAMADSCESLATPAATRLLEMTETTKSSQGWLGPGVVGIGTASFLADVGHEIPTALLPNLLTATLGAPAAALGLIEGVSDGLAGTARLAGGAIADDPQRRRAQAVAGYATTAVLSSLIGAATAVWQVGILRAGAWAARGLRVPARNALLADIVPATIYGRAYGFERAMDNLGAIAGPLLALVLVGLVGTRTAIALSIIPGLLAALAIVYAIRHAPPPAEERERQPLRLRVRPVLTGRLGRLMVGVSAFEFGNVAATLLILRATQLLAPGRDQDRANQLALGLYVAYNVAATLASIPAGRLGDRRGAVLVLVLGVGLFGLAYAGFATGATSVLALAPWFLAAGVAIGCVETAEHAAVAAHAPVELRGSAFGLLAAVQSFGNLAASAIAGLLWTAVSPRVAFVYLAAWMLLALVGLLPAAGGRSSAP
jgi:MFS family permease